ncbi:response regulator containing a CheY-like receiver domain and an HD-GYP domain [Herbaspirillum sp. CF444]|uniref:HD domain-containing phosphohydrolase n=1 Tax=Herbaspirillum sp. CF444 TaxID=1144319 RepID=UPI0002727360|nr:HD domain-containing phosphohydrolase [Herbaspirillum sp. CF444]EJL92389.1 response regulator containing a CheY-like receiver domain and an HD-GYP domain [Herbaspirillum sp. CF444]
MSNTVTASDPPAVENVLPSSVILLVDDEASILSSLKRVLRPKGYTLLTAESGAEGLRLLEQNTVDLIISDMRMPEMTGAQFLGKAKERYPEVTRILLTGYSEITSTVSAINDGGIYHYLQKPWDEQDLLLTIQRALEQQHLKKEAARLNEVVRKQNEELLTFNARLEKQVQARTEEIRQTVMFLENSQAEIKLNFLTMLKVFSNMIELRSGMLGGQSDRVSGLCRRLGKKFKIPEFAIQDLAIAGLLHAIGKIGLPDELIRKPQEKMSGEESRVFMTHPVKGHVVLTPVAAFKEVGDLILHQYERYDGRGLPEGLSGDEIPLGSRILAVARDFEALRSGAIATLPLPLDKSIQIIKSQSGHRYDPAVVDSFIALVNEGDSLLAERSRDIKSRDLEVGMQLAEDLRTHEGVLLIVQDSIITASNIQQIRKFERLEDIALQISIKVLEKDA